MIFYLHQPFGWRWVFETFQSSLVRPKCCIISGLVKNLFVISGPSRTFQSSLPRPGHFNHLWFIQNFSLSLASSRTFSLSLVRPKNSNHLKFVRNSSIFSSLAQNHFTLPLGCPEVFNLLWPHPGSFQIISGLSRTLRSSLASSRTFYSLYTCPFGFLWRPYYIQAEDPFHSKSYPRIIRTKSRFKGTTLTCGWVSAHISSEKLNPSYICSSWETKSGSPCL